MLKGTLDDFTLPDILRFLASSGKTGCVEVSRSEGDGRVFLREGGVYYGESSLTRGLDQADEAAIRRQIEDAFFDLLRWGLGEFTFSPEIAVSPAADVNVDVETLITEAASKLEELEVISTKIPNEHAIPAMAPNPPGDSAQINIAPEEWRVLVLVTGTRSVDEIADQVGRDNFSVMRTLYGLASTGLIEVVAAPEAPEPVAEMAMPAEPTSDVAEDPELDGSDGQTDPYVAALSSPLEGEALIEQMDAEFPPFQAETDLHSGAPDANADPPEQEADALPLAVADDTETTEEEATGEPADEDELDDSHDGDAYDDDEESADEESDEEREDDERGTVADLAGAEAGPEAADIPIEETTENVVDRLAAVKELADLFDRNDDDAAGPPYPAELATQRAAAAAMEPNGDGRRRVEDDEEITRGLISRLIDGVKGL